MPPNANRILLAVPLGIAVTLLANLLGFLWIRGTDFADNAFYDGSALCLTLLIPSLLGGVVMGLVARGAAFSAAAVTFGIFTVIGLWHPFWRIPRVSPQSAHSGLMHYFLYNPLVALAFGTLGAWLTAQFTTGRWTLTDAEPIIPNQDDD
jgi:hypothetical protein